MVTAPETALPPAGYGIAEVERILGIPRKTGYKLVKDGKLQAFVSTDGALRVHPFEIYRYISSMEEAA